MFTGQSQNKKKDPLDYNNKTKYMSKAFRGVNVVKNKSIKTLFDALQYLDNKGFDSIKMVVGSDRVSEFKSLINKYLKDYGFKTFDIISAGERDPDAEGVSGMSASKMRAAAARDDVHATPRLVDLKQSTLRASSSQAKRYAPVPSTASNRAPSMISPNVTKLTNWPVVGWVVPAVQSAVPGVDLWKIA